MQFQEGARTERKESVLFLEHYPCLTGGLGAKAENLLATQETLKSRSIELIQINRGGDYTAHEPGQIVGYPHFDLKKRDKSLGTYLQALTIAVRNAILEIWKLEVEENRTSPGLYLKDFPDKKLVSMGVYAKSYFTSFGFALNGVNDLSTFQWIHPCGGLSSNMISLKRLGKVKDWEKEKLRFAGAMLFHLERLIL
ncbi:lipoyl(octanoyl) transferase LipB [Leptospira idonii]|uniref:lipoyl(octanoyl) transferase LipB n=1 Tax=Leptospira idonii TaxID=1193500 RepID=UPI001FE43103|nr:lipoyl(octanoyl) transferase LipB [Leptospira idonii]